MKSRKVLTKRGLLVAAFIVQVLITVAVARMVGHDENGEPSEGWKPTILMKFFNSDPGCKHSMYSGGFSTCETAYDKESWLALILMVLLLISAIAIFVYIGRLWYRKIRRS